ncbi:MAG TPA: hypothetical protein VKB86_19955 [Pyrinomonadaceae bacterium]|nr:hypothetical protein [Pyrinomonadaceae bacterium]
MEAKQIALPFRLITGKEIRDGRDNTDLIGRSFMDGPSTITIMSVCLSNPEQVMVERDLNGKRWSVPAGVIRLIVGHKKKRRVA